MEYRLNVKIPAFSLLDSVRSSNHKTIILPILKVSSFYRRHSTAFITNERITMGTVMVFVGNSGSGDWVGNFAVKCLYLMKQPGITFGTTLW